MRAQACREQRGRGGTGGPRRPRLGGRVGLRDLVGGWLWLAGRRALGPRTCHEPGGILHVLERRCERAAEVLDRAAFPRLGPECEVDPLAKLVGKIATLAAQRWNVCAQAPG